MSSPVETEELNFNFFLIRDLQALSPTELSWDAKLVFRAIFERSVRAVGSLTGNECCTTNPKLSVFSSISPIFSPAGY